MPVLNLNSAAVPSRPLIVYRPLHEGTLGLATRSSTGHAWLSIIDLIMQNPLLMLCLSCFWAATWSVPARRAV